MTIYGVDGNEVGTPREDESHSLFYFKKKVLHIGIVKFQNPIVVF